jgi:hypothetical protein
MYMNLIVHESNVTKDTSEKFQVSCDNSTHNTTAKCGRNVTIQETEVDILGVKMSLGTNVTVDQKYSGRSVVVQMSLGRSVGGRSIKVPRTGEVSSDLVMVFFCP